MLNQKASVLDRGTEPLLPEEADSGWSDASARGAWLWPTAGAWTPPVLNQFGISLNADQAVGGPNPLSRAIAVINAGQVATALLSRGGFGRTLARGIPPFQSRLAALLSSSASLLARPNAGGPAFSFVPDHQVAQASSSTGTSHWINSSGGYGPSAFEGPWTPMHTGPVIGSEHLPNAAAGMAGRPASHSRLVDPSSTSSMLSRPVSFQASPDEAALPSSARGGSAVNSLFLTTDRADYAPGSTATFSAAGIGSGASVTFNIADLVSAPGANGIADVYTPFTIKDGGIGDMDGLANGTVVAQWQVPADGRATGATLQLTATSGAQTGTATFSDAGNKIVTENQLPGTPKSTWAIHGSIANAGDSQIEGFATQISTNAGQTVSFKIDTASSVTGYTLDIYRLGYYGGNGAHLIGSMHHTGTDNQPNPIFNSATKTVDAGNWSVTDSWTIPSTAVSGVYFAKLTTDTGDDENMIPFIVRNDGTTSGILFQTSDQTWEAYNPWGGYNLYQGPNGKDDRAYAVSYNRPIAMNSTSNLAGPADFLFGEEYAAIYWLEQNGYDVSYISGIDAATSPGLLRNTNAYIDVGHDEYWTQSQFANVKAAADAGVDLAFLSGNQIYWDTELAPSFDASHTPNRTIVEYKDIWSGTQLDPNGTANGGAGLFRDPVYGPGTPENSLSGTIFTVDDLGTLDNITIPANMSQLRFWRNTSVASGNGGTLTHLLGYEWDSDLDNGFRPAGLIDMSSTTRNVNTLLLDNGLTTGSGTATHSLTLYRDTTSGALVFGAGTVMWSWGLSDQHADYRGLTAPVSTAVQQSMVNLFADMGVTPQTLQASLVLAQASADHTVPTSVITSPTGGTSFNQDQTVTITGTASDVGGRVAGVEVSTDGGTTWHPASGTTNWSYAWAAVGPGTHVIEARATDDSVNLQTTPAMVSVNVNGTTGASLFAVSNTPAQTNLNDRSPIEVGVKFTSSTAGQITALKFYRSPGDTGSDLLDLWSSTGTKLASATFTNTTASGWQTVTLATPVSIAANTTYVASYHTNGAYVATNNFFSSAFTSGSLTAPSSAAAGGNGVYAYGGTSSAGLFPTSTFGASNYWADVVFTASTGGGTDRPPVAVNDSGFTTTQNTALNIPASALLANDSDPDGDPLTITGVSSPANGTATFSANTVTFTPTTGYTGPASFTYAISDGRGDTGGASVSLTVTTSSSTTASLFTGSNTPAQTNLNDRSPIEVGVKFTSSTAGQITALKFYRSPGDTGSDLLDLWSSTGTKLASATFTNTTASGWQTVTLATPVSIAANTTYVASYHTNGAYVATNNFFSSAFTSGSLTAPSSAAAGGNGVYAYGGTSSAGLFPTSTFGASNYWADVVFTASTGGGTDRPPVAVNDSGFTTTQNTALNIPASALLANDSDPDGDPLTITGVSSPANGTATFSANTVTFTPTTGYTGPASFTYAISDGRGDTASATASLTVLASSSSTVSLFSSNPTPSVVTASDPHSVELGMKFQASTGGDITGLRFYKGPSNTGTHVADLWSSTGTLLATATFSTETTSGWQQVNFSTPVTITAGTTYIASYHTAGNYSADPNLFANSVTNGPLTAPSSASSGGNGVYAYGTGSLFPTNTFNSTSYAVDVLFRAQLAA
ncbi:DUF4082 domain-containing protein [Bradyrhizobium canariense]|uniref:Mo-co oxidoreductase dimerization domain protein n=1 Tax=Bradyrhizobium canariense TaxID=255045 RepID=A0A1X3HAR6_9BRAD|nr:DUF4082 domain-containing protein [Bradyrhizobium canariense]OSI72465.1 Mo-co oxidoreductase dimerization domain protein [Bradyrhizobium canariense]OSI80857.1 Mo-co oxidoreductase dimerization domain protein [Bradyrhizobium canariense]OSI93786.1 Mo-co oxidoreductase dimerization domain protein [Bradyrhizobium canariense]OSJ14451.1 Mo-co oxidoreductase dimerization domain protein [Bradyrhizobium canariense]